MAKETYRERGSDEGGAGRRRLRRIVRRAGELYAGYTAGLKAGDFKRLFTEETRAIYQHFSLPDESDEQEGGKRGRLRRALRTTGRTFWGFLLAMSPARRVLYGIAFIIFAVATVVVLTAPEGSAIREDVAVLSIYSFVIVSFLLALELANKLSARDEIEIARDVQLSLLPPENPRLAGLDLVSFTAPAAEVGGDYYDFAEMPPRVAVAIGDVSGHGLASGLVMAMAKSAFRAQLLNDPDPRRVLATLNEIVLDAGDSRTLMTFLCCMIDSRSGHMTYANAGHIYPLLHRPSDGSQRWLESSSYPLGVRREQQFECRELQLRPGDVLCLLSDGIVETVGEDGESYGYSRLVESVRRCGDGEPSEIMKAVLHDLQGFAASTPQADDLTLIIARFRPEG